MTDNPDPAGTVTSDLSGVPQPSIDPLPAISYEQASSLKQELLANEEWRTKYINGDIECRRQMDQIYRGLTTPPAAPPNPGEAIVEHLRQHADISEDVADEIRSGRASTPYEYQRALELRDHLFQDEEWMQNHPVDAHGRAQEQGIGSDHWLANCEEHMIERHLTAVLRFEGPSAQEAMKQKIARLRANRGRK